ncbi:hypothetical protein DUI87_10724 [Hirundo rustica rustica]|uniref:Uncharacterized protein n=1 Tax=Hirundo rustica rustica TaxID=333673 RepID=A0A3M0KQN9_HIRRU|nr:hypothetical protein DUI87_10724 [Hirundo rustica rustica]
MGCRELQGFVWALMTTSAHTGKQQPRGLESSLKPTADFSFMTNVECSTPVLLIPQQLKREHELFGQSVQEDHFLRDDGGQELDLAKDMDRPTFCEEELSHDVGDAEKASVPGRGLHMALMRGEQTLWTKVQFMEFREWGDILCPICYVIQLGEKDRYERNGHFSAFLNIPSVASVKARDQHMSKQLEDMQCFERGRQLHCTVMSQDNSHGRGSSLKSSIAHRREAQHRLWTMIITDFRIPTRPIVFVLGPYLALHYEVEMGAAVEVDWGDVGKVPRSQEAEEYINGPLHAILLPAAVRSISRTPILPLSKINQGAPVLTQIEFSAFMDL